MAKPSHSKNDDGGRGARSGRAPTSEPLGLEGFEQPPRDEGLSLDELSQAYAKLLDRGAEPYEDRPPEENPPEQTLPGEESGVDAAASETGPPLEQSAPYEPPAFEPAAFEPAAEHDPADEACELSPRSILEAMLFVGHPQNEPLTSREVAALMRGVRPAEIDELVGDLNAAYEAEGCPYTIVSQGAGYRLALRPQFDGLRDRFYGRIREARLSQAAIDTLAIVAYNQPVGREEVERLRGRPSGSILLQLVRRELLRIERPEQRPRKPRYLTTERFLDVFGLESLDDLPQSQDLER